MLRLDAFGSATGDAFQPGRSDCDFLVELHSQALGSRAERLIGLAEALEALPGAAVELVNPRCIRNPHFAAELARTRVPFCERASSEDSV